MNVILIDRAYGKSRILNILTGYFRNDRILICYEVTATQRGWADFDEIQNRVAYPGLPKKILNTTKFPEFP